MRFSVACPTLCVREKTTVDATKKHFCLCLFYRDNRSSSIVGVDRIGYFVATEETVAVHGDTWCGVNSKRDAIPRTLFDPSAPNLIRIHGGFRREEHQGKAE